MDGHNRLGQIDRAYFTGGHRRMAARCIGPHAQRHITLFRHPDHHCGLVDDRRIGGDDPAFVNREQRLHLARGQPLGGGGGAGSAHFLIMAGNQIDRPFRLEALRGKCLHRFEQGDQRPLVVNRPAPPDRAFGNGPGEGLILPVFFGARRNRDHILMGHDDDRLRGGIAARPGIDQRLVQHFALHRRVRLGIGGHQPAMQLVPFGQLVLAGILIADRLEPHRLGQMPCGKVGVKRGERGNLDRRTVRHCLRGESNGPDRNDAAQRQCRNANAQHPLVHARLPVSL